MEKIPVIVVVGPTASGKTSLAIEIAKKFDGEIISFDSMQIYKELSISTAKPTDDERAQVPHHLIDFLSVNDTFSVAQFCALATKKVQELREKGKIPVFVGGTGLYIDSFINNIDFSVQTDSALAREKVEAIEKEKGAQALYQLLKDVDEQSADTIHPNNIKRVKRALEIYFSSGEVKSELDQKSRETTSPYLPIYFGINFEDRQALYDRINTRVDKMIEQGLIDEARRFFENENSITSVQAIGCKELKPYLDGVLSLDECVENLKRETRRYAKRQITWFKRNDKINWVYPDRTEYSEILETVFKKIEEFLD